MKKKLFHSNFKLQGKTFNTVEELLIFSKELSEDIYSFLELWFNENDFIEVQTSGSTGKPKRVLLKKKYMINSALATGKFFNLFENTKALLCLIVGGAPVSNKLLKQIQKVDSVIFGTYGMTETITHIAVKKLNNFSFLAESSQKIRHAELVSASHYLTLPNIKISKDERDCLVIDAPKISDDVIITNDIVELISENEFKWIGRYDSIINSGGVKLFPEKIENILASSMVFPFFVAGIKDEILGEKLILVIENFDKSRSKATIFNQINKLETLTKYQKPKEIYFVTEFVKTPTDKINRKETLKKLFKVP